MKSRQVSLQGGTPSHIPIIDLARTVSILLVLGVHLGYARFYSFSHPDISVVTWLCFARNGAYGVSLFFLISGFLISKILIRSHEDYRNINLRDFYGRRIGRILPLMTLVLVAGGLFLTIPSRSTRMLFCFRSHDPTPGLWLSIITFTFNWFREWHLAKSQIFGMHWDVLWSLSVEEQFYLFYPLLLRRTRSARNTIVMLSGFVILGPLARCFPLWFPTWRILGAISHSFGCFDLIAFGGLLFFADKQISLSGSWKRFLLGAGIIVMGAVYLITRAGSHLQMIYSPTLLDLGLFMFLLGGLGIEFKPGIFMKLLCLPGKLSYGIYLLHAMVLFMSWNLYRLQYLWMSFILFVILNTLVAFVSYHWYEKPLNLRVRALISGEVV